MIAKFGEVDCLSRREQFATELRRQTKSKIMTDRRRRIQDDFSNL